MKKTILLSAFLLYSIFSFGQATVVWDGGGDGHSWNDGDNWNPNSVPAAGDFVKLKKNVTIDGTATNNPGRIIIVKQGTNPSSVVLDLDLTIDGISGQHSITFNEGCTLTVSNGRTLSVTAPNNRNGINTSNANQNASFINNGSVTFSGCKNGILLDGTGCSVENNGTITITSPSADGIHISNYTGAQFANNGTLTITSPASDGIESSANFTNDGTISIVDANTNGIYNKPGAVFNNSGTISITNPGSTTNDGINSEAEFNNNLSGAITINKPGDDCIELTDGTFTNNGDIDVTIEDGANYVNNGIAIGTTTASATFVNNSNNSVNAHGGPSSKGRAIYVYEAGTLNNNGKITVDGSIPVLLFIQKEF